MYRASIVFKVVKKADAAVLFGAKQGSVKLGSDEKFAQAAVEYLYEKNQPNDPKKRAADVENERLISAAFDRLSGMQDRVFSMRLDRLTAKMSEALEKMPAELRDEACLLNSEQPPLNLRRPSLTPPIPGFEPAFGLDVPQLRTQQEEYPTTWRPDDSVRAMMGECVVEREDDVDASLREGYPFADTDAVRSILHSAHHELDSVHDSVRVSNPRSGARSEAFEAHFALQRKALARQELLLELVENDELAERWESDPEFRMEEFERRGILPLFVDEPFIDTARLTSQERAAASPIPTAHWSQSPKYQPIRAD